MQTLDTKEFLDRFGDVIDDRVAEVIDEILQERDALRLRARLRPGLAALVLLVAAAVSALLQHSALAAGTIWLSAAAICLAASWPTQPQWP